MVVLLAMAASFLFPGCGQAFICGRRCIVVWSAIGIAPIALVFVTAPAVWLLIVARFAAAIHAAVVVRRAVRAGGIKPDYQRAGIVAVVHALIFGTIRATSLEGYNPRSSSMLPALGFGDHMMVDKLTPRFVGYERGQLVVFHHPSGSAYVKRLIAVGGDTVEVRRGQLIVNGVATTVTELGPTTYDDFDEVRETWHPSEVRALREQYAGHSYVIYRERRDDDFNDFPSLLSDGTAPCEEATAQDWPGDGPTFRQPPMTLAADGHSCTVPPGTLFFMGDNRDNSNDSRRWGVIPESQTIGRVIGLWRSRDWSRLGHVD